MERCDKKDFPALLDAYLAAPRGKKRQLTTAQICRAMQKVGRRNAEISEIVRAMYVSASLASEA